MYSFWERQNARTCATKSHGAVGERGCFVVQMVSSRSASLLWRCRVQKDMPARDNVIHVKIVDHTKAMKFYVKITDEFFFMLLCNSF